MKATISKYVLVMLFCPALFAQQDLPGSRPQDRTTTPGTPGRDATRKQDRHTGATAGNSFLDRALELNAAEAQLGQLGQRKAQNPRVKQYAHQIVVDNSHSWQRLRNVRSGAISWKTPQPTDQQSSSRNTPDNLAATLEKSTAPQTAQERSGQGRSPADQTTRQSTSQSEQTALDGPTRPANRRNSTLNRAHQETVQRLERLSGAEFDRQYIETMLNEHRRAIQMFEQEARTLETNERITGSDPETTKMNTQISTYARETLPELQRHLTEAENIQRDLQNAR